MESAAAVEVTNLPLSATFDELRAVVGAQAAVFSLNGPHLSALVLLESSEAAQQVVELLHGSAWGDRTLALRHADVGVWLAARYAKYMSGAAEAGLGSRGGGGASGAAAAPLQQAPQSAAQPPSLSQQAQQAQQAAFVDAAPRAPGFELPDWGWDQAAGTAQQAQQAQQAQHSAAAAAEDAWADEAWPDEYWESVSGASGGAGGAAAGASDAWQEVGGRASRAPAGVAGASWTVAAARGPALDELQGHDVSSTRLVIRNLHPDCTQQAVLKVFTKYGRVLQLIKNASRRFAHLEFARPESAAAAMRELHGKLVPELNDQGVLLLQPSLTASDPAARTARAAEMQQRLRSSGGGGGGGGSGGQTPMTDASKGISVTPTPSLWVGSIGGDATSGDLRTVFARFGALQQWQLQEARLPGKSELKWAIVRFHSTQDAVAAMEGLHKKVVPLLGPHPLKLKYRTS